MQTAPPTRGRTNQAYSSDRTRTCDPGLMNPLLCQLSYAAMLEGDFMAWEGSVQPGNLAPGCLDYWARTLLIVKIGKSKARATPPMIRPMTTIMMGSM